MFRSASRALTFDDLDRPDPGLIRECVHCGLCLSACPTYRVLGTEMDSPRGRIYLIKGVMEGAIPLGRSFVEHIDLCLNCRACETACPSGVRYGEIVEAARGQIERKYRRPLAHRIARWVLLRGLLPHPWRLGMAGAFLREAERRGLRKWFLQNGLLRRMPLTTPALEEMLPSVPGGAARRLSEVTPPMGEGRARVAFLAGCVMPIFFPAANLATVRLLARNGCTVVTPAGQRCCGALHVHGGDRAMARRLARHNIRVFEEAEVEKVVVNSAGCGAMLKEYAHLLEADPAFAGRAARLSEKVVDVSEYLYELSPLRGTPQRLRRRVAYQDACHLRHVQKVAEQPRALLRRVPGLELLEMAHPDWCCGSAGVYNLLQPEMALQILDETMERFKATGADTLAVGNPGCLFQFRLGMRRHGLDAQVLHPAELLDAAYAEFGEGGAAKPTGSGQESVSVRHREEESPA